MNEAGPVGLGPPAQIRRVGAVSVHPGRPDALAEFMLGVDFQSGRSCEDGVEVYFLITILYLKILIYKVPIIITQNLKT